MEGVRVSDASVGEPKQIQTPRAWYKEKNRMKNLTGLWQRSFSSWGTKLASVALIITVALFSVPAGAGDDNNQESGKHDAPGKRLQKLAGAWSVETTVVLQQATFPTLMTFTSDGIVLADEPPNPLETTGHGNWVATGRRSAAFTFRAFIGLEIDGQSSASLKVVGKLEYNAHADKWSGPFKIQILDAAGNEMLADSGTMIGTRIAVETLD